MVNSRCVQITLALKDSVRAVLSVDLCPLLRYGSGMFVIRLIFIVLFVGLPASLWAQASLVADLAPRLHRIVDEFVIAESLVRREREIHEKKVKFSGLELNALNNYIQDLFSDNGTLRLEHDREAKQWTHVKGIVDNSRAMKRVFVLNSISLTQPGKGLTEKTLNAVRQHAEIPGIRYLRSAILLDHDDSSAFDDYLSFLPSQASNFYYLKRLANCKNPEAPKALMTVVFGEFVATHRESKNIQTARLNRLKERILPRYVARELLSRLGFPIEVVLTPEEQMLLESLAAQKFNHEALEQAAKEIVDSPLVPDAYLVN